MNTTITFKLKDRLLRAGGETVSGQQLAEEFGVSRTAIWKHIKELEEQGYAIRSVRKKGYQLTGLPDTLQPETIQAFLDSKQIGQVIEYRDTVTSTQVVAHQLAQEGAAHGTVVIAETQTAGRGRLSRPWESAERQGVWMSIILRPDIPPQKAPQFTLVTAVAVVRAIEEVTGLHPEIKWPNDILLNGKKTTGILTELQAEMGQIHALIIGIGLNVNQKEEDFPEPLRPIATSLRIEEGRPIDRIELVRALFKQLEVYTDLYVDRGFGPIKLLWESYSTAIGKRIRATGPREIIEGTALGITDDGVLEIRTDDGRVHAVYSADIELQN